MKEAAPSLRRLQVWVSRTYAPSCVAHVENRKSLVPAFVCPSLKNRDGWGSLSRGAQE